MKTPEENIPSKTLVIGIYSHIEFYPPSLNALFHLAPLFDKVYILVRNVLISDWSYPPNVILIPSGRYIQNSKLAELSMGQKLSQYVTYGFNLRKLILTTRPSVVLLYDTIAFSLFNIFSRGVRWTGGRPIVWYHNHDITVEGEVGRFSFMNLMRRLELRYLRRANIFSLPTEKRLQFFPSQSCDNNVFIIPNYPSRFFFGSWKSSSPVYRTVKLIFQGHISESNHLEDFIALLPNAVLGCKLELHLAGPIGQSYRDSLEHMAESLDVKSQLHIYGRLPYKRLPDLTASCHIGLAIYGHHNTMVRTMSTASNKIFEYASIGLPVIINEREDLQNEFKEYPWIHFFNHGQGNIAETIEVIVRNYKLYSRKSREDFENKLNFEIAFQPVLERLKGELVARKEW